MKRILNKRTMLALLIGACLCLPLFGCQYTSSEEDHRGDKVVDDLQYPDKNP